MKEAANSCKVQSLRDEGHSIAQKAQEVLRQIEERVGPTAAALASRSLLLQLKPLLDSVVRSVVFKGIITL